MLTYYCAVPENIHTPPNGRDWNFQMGGGGVWILSGYAHYELDRT